MAENKSSNELKVAKKTITQDRVESKLNELRYRTADSKKMLNKWLASDVIKEWTEEFKDEDTGNLIPIKRNEILFKKGLYLDQDNIQRIQFSIEADGIKDVEVSNQHREGYEYENEALYSFLVQISSNLKNRKYLLLASGVENAADITRDYLEINSDCGFIITMIKKMDPCTILNDSRLYDDVDIHDCDNDEPEYDEDGNEIKPEVKTVKFFQIDLNIKTQVDIMMDGEGDNRTFIVQTYSAEDAMLLIKSYLEESEDDRIERVLEQAKKNGKEPDEDDLERMHFVVSTLKLGPLPIYDMIPRELSESHNQKS